MPIRVPVRVPSEGKKLDLKLLRALEDSVAGNGDGRVSKKDVEEKVARHIRDAGVLTDTEIATIEHAAKHLKFTSGAKDALGAIAQELRGKPVFEWQRTSTVDPRTAPKLPLTGKAVEQAATDWVLRNVEPILGASADKALPHLDSGNNGLTPYLLSGKKQDEAVALFLALAGNNPPDELKNFDPKKHQAIFTVGTEDETHIFLAILDKTTGKTVDIGDQNTVDIGYGMDEAAFNKIFGDFRKFTSDPNDPSAEFDYLDGYLLAEYLEKGAVPLDVPHSEDKDKAFERLSKVANTVMEQLGDDSYRMPIDVSVGKLPVVEDLPTMARLMFEAGRDEDSGIDYKHEGVKINVGAREDWMPSIAATIAQAMVTSYPHEKGAAALPALKQKIADSLAALGKPGDIGLYQVSAKVKDENNAAKTTDALTYAFINEKTGQYLSMYTRPDLT